jgi:hypothetical protein
MDMVASVKISEFFETVSGSIRVQKQFLHNHSNRPFLSPKIPQIPDHRSTAGGVLVVVAQRFLAVLLLFGSHKPQFVILSEAKHLLSSSSGRRLRRAAFSSSPTADRVITIHGRRPAKFSPA